MDRARKLYYYKNVVKRYLRDQLILIEDSKSDMERSFYIDRYDVQLRDFARALNVNEKHLDAIIKKEQQ